MKEKKSDNKNNIFMSGDQFDGIVVSDYSNDDYSFSINNANIEVTQRITLISPNRACLGFLIRCQVPSRFRIDVKIPKDCENAMVSLNEHKLIGFFSDNIPENPEYFIDTMCDDEKAISTLKPGQFQSINFLWQSGDILKFFFYY